MYGAYRLAVRLDQHRIDEVVVVGTGEMADVPVVEGFKECVVGGYVNADRSQDASDELICGEWMTRTVVALGAVWNDTD